MTSLLAAFAYAVGISLAAFALATVVTSAARLVDLARAAYVRRRTRRKVAAALDSLAAQLDAAIADYDASLRATARERTDAKPTSAMVTPDAPRTVPTIDIASGRLSAVGIMADGSLAAPTHIDRLRTCGASPAAVKLAEYQEVYAFLKSPHKQ